MTKLGGSISEGTSGPGLFEGTRRTQVASMKAERLWTGHCEWR